ncbi:hypothetical protein LAZ67_20000678 [Cordylochernes scorpioides]|uniref:Uncharacterized protein n=1 Tax=Cordylochernes scorpioides TaxID=51811 RepID=A0ABY6LJN4_9ARAC|nr:hypothetical protein LAZ67_20000678 [Cordylochernes scorpioides]
MRVRKIQNKEMLPLETLANFECSLIQNTEKFFCFKGGILLRKRHLLIVQLKVADGWLLLFQYFEG